MQILVGNERSGKLSVKKIFLTADERQIVKADHIQYCSPSHPERVMETEYITLEKLSGYKV